jgi:hypothetical protein
VNRLRFLAHEGLLAQSWVLVPAMGASSQAAALALQAASKVNPAVAGHMVQAFDAPPLDGKD